MFRFIPAILVHVCRITGGSHVTRTFSIPLSSADAYYMVVDSSVGGSSASVRLVIDTASTLTWVPSDACVSCEGHTIISDPRGHTGEWAVAYGSGNVSGNMVMANIAVGPRDSPSVNISMGSATNVDIPWYPLAAFDGVLALGYSTNSSASSFVETLYATGTIEEMIFALDLESDKSSYLTFGSRSEMDCVRSLSWSPVVYKPYWSVDIFSVSFGDHVSISAAGMVGIIDSGSSVISVPSDYWEEFFGTLLSNNTVPCNEPDKFPFLNITLANSQTVSISPSEYFIPSLNPGECLMAISVSGASPESPLYNKWILGLPFLRSRRTVFDIDNDRMGICQLDRKMIASKSGARPSAIALFLLTTAALL